MQIRRPTLQVASLMLVIALGWLVLTGCSPAPAAAPTPLTQAGTVAPLPSPVAEATGTAASPPPSASPNTAWPTAVPVETVAVEEVRLLLASAQPPVLYDARSRGEYDEGHIPGALSLPLGELDSRLAEIPRDRLVVFYCHGGT